MSKYKVGERQNKTIRNSEDWTDKLLNLVRAQLMGLAVACLVLGAASAMIYTGIIGYTKATSAIAASCILGSFTSGMLTGKKEKRGNILLGIGAGGMLFLILFAAGTLLYDAMPSGSSVWLVGGACLCGGGLSGFFGRKKIKTKRR